MADLRWLQSVSIVLATTQIASGRRIQVDVKPDRIVRIKTVLARTGLSRSTIYRKINEGTFPTQVKISIHGSGWRESAINQWLDDPASYRAEPRQLA